MTYVSKVDMGEVTRLTREGRLNDAMALLRGETPGAPPLHPDNDGSKPQRAAGPILDMTRACSSGGPWSLNGDGDRASSDPTDAGKRAKDGAYARGARFAAPGGQASHTKWPATRKTSVALVPEGARFADRAYRGPAGTLGYKLYVPSSYEAADAPVPLVLMLHGCTQSPDDFAAGTRMNELAEEMGFLVVYPSQSQRANAHRCWNWFLPADQRRDGGEAALIAAIAREVLASHRIDPARVYAAGLSAGGAAAAILGQRHPDLFAAIGIHSGLACGAAADMPSAFAAMQGRASVRVLKSGRPIATIVFHGDSDRTVAPVNGDQVMNQATAGRTTTTLVETGRSKGGVAYTRTVHRLDNVGQPVLFESWTLHGAGHAWAGGSAAGSYTDPNGPDASRAMLRFFAEVSRTRPISPTGLSSDTDRFAIEG